MTDPITTAPAPPTERQMAYLRAVQRRLNLPDRMLDDAAVQRFGVAAGGLDRGQASALIEELKGWQEIDAEVGK